MQACDSKRTTSRLIVAMLTAAALALVGCTSSESSDGGTQSTGSSTSAEANPDSDSDQKVGPLARYADHRSDVYEKPESWLCRPDVEDVCDTELDSTVIQADGTMSVEKWKSNPDAPIDCFYVYPTISRDVATFSDMVASGDEEGFAARNQVARLGSECRVFAPIYRQRTLAGLTTLMQQVSAGDANSAASKLEGTAQPDPTTAPVDPDAPDDTSALKDVTDAWKTYMARDNNSRGVVLIGHSQGAALLTQLIRNEIDPNSDVRELLVSAYLAGWSVQVPKGADVGGVFKNVSLCRKNDQVGCVVTWSSYRASSPPPADAIFGRPGTDDENNPTVAGCNSPANLAGGPAQSHSYFTAEGASILGSLGVGEGNDWKWVDPSKGTVDTRYVSTPGLTSVECATANDFNYLAVTINADPSDPRADDIGGELTPQWGFHLQDINLVMGDIVTLVGSQSKAWRG